MARFLFFVNYNSFEVRDEIHRQLHWPRFIIAEITLTNWTNSFDQLRREFFSEHDKRDDRILFWFHPVLNFTHNETFYDDECQTIDRASQLTHKLTNYELGYLEYIVMSSLSSEAHSLNHAIYRENFHVIIIIQLASQESTTMDVLKLNIKSFPSAKKKKKNPAQLMTRQTTKISYRSLSFFSSFVLRLKQMKEWSDDHRIESDTAMRRIHVIKN